MRPLFHTNFLTTSCLTAVMLLTASAHANPINGTVTSGSATINTNGATLNIHQTTGKAIIDWGGFDISAGETTSFHQPSSSSVTLNRVHSANASAINGNLTANGTIFIVNQNGVLFGAGSKVDVNSLVVSTADITNERFNAGEYKFDMPGNPTATIENRGRITAGEAGLVGMVAPNVINSGVIQARLGRVHLASGDKATVDLYGDGLMEVALSDAVTEQLVRNTGTIQAEGGTVALTAAAGANVVNSLIHVSGELRAPSIGMKNGKIIIAAEGSNAVSGNVTANKGQKTGVSTVIVDGVLDASGKNPGETGGSITVTGDHVAIMETAQLDASGAEGGGTIHVGGEYLGGGTTPTAEITIVQSGAMLNAQAMLHGNGGEVIVYADNRTEFGGNINASGAGDQGNGGFVETSGKYALLSFGNVRIIAGRNAKAGTWLLDPADITVTAATNTNIGGAPNFTATATASQVSAASIVANLDAGTNVSITTSNDGFAGNGDIIVSSAITTTGTGSLTFSAYRNITVSSAITLNGGTLTLRANNAGAADGSTGAGAISISAAIATNGGNVVIGGGSGAITAGSGYAVGNTALATGVSISNSITAAGGSIIVNGKGYAASSSNSIHGISISGAVNTTSSGTISLSGIAGGLAGNSSSSAGVYISNAVSVVDGGLSVTGIGGGAGSGSGSYGIQVTGASGSLLTQGIGAMNLHGTGGALGTGGFNYGVSSASSNGIKSSGAGNISITGIGGGDASNVSGRNVGVAITAANGITSTSTGNITINGTGGAAGSSSGTNFGVMVESSGSITATSSGQISITGTGGSAGGSNHGVIVRSSGAITGGGGAMTISGTSGNGTGDSNIGVWISSATVSNVGSGSIGITAIARGASNSASDYGMQVNSAGIVETVNGAITISGTGGGAGTGTSNVGVYILNASSTVRTIGNGSISITGNGGGTTSGGAGGTNVGVLINTGTTVQTAGGGTITIEGTGGVSNNSGNHGVSVVGSVLGSGGLITVTGTAGNGTASNNFGVNVNAGTISNSGSGAMTINGTGRGTGNSAGARGVNVEGGGVISTINGVLSITGTGGGAGTGGNNYGVYVTASNSTIKTTGTGALNITATGGTGGGANNYAILSTIGYGIQTTSSGSITINATRGAGSNNVAVRPDIANAIATTGTGNITIYADLFQLGGANYINSVGSLTIAPKTNNGTMAIGTTGSTLILSNTELGYLTAASYIFGASTTGDLTINTTKDFGTKNMSFISGGNISLAASLTKATGAGTASYLFRANGNIVNTSGVGVTATTGSINLTMTSDDDVSGAGSITLTNAPLSVNGGTITLNSNGQSITQSGSIGGNETINSGNGSVSIGTLNGDTANTRSLTVNGGAGSFTTTGAIGATNKLNDLTVTSSAMTLGDPLTGAGIVTLTSVSSITLPSIAASKILVQTTGHVSDITIASGKTLTASGNDTAITLASGRNFINNGNASALTLTGGGRFLIYSTNASSDTLNGLTSSFVRNGCTYGSGCSAGVSIPATGNGFIYSYQPPQESEASIVQLPATVENAATAYLSRFSYQLMSLLDPTIVDTFDTLESFETSGEADDKRRRPTKAKRNGIFSQEKTLIYITPDLARSLNLDPTEI